MRIERELSTDLGEAVVVYIEHPVSSGRKNEFFCKIGLTGAGIDVTTAIYGIDPMQALLLSTRYIYTFVKKNSDSLHPRRLTWKQGENQNDLGLELQ